MKTGLKDVILGLVPRIQPSAGGDLPNSSDAAQRWIKK
jgi:hypothetical protein